MVARILNRSASWARSRTRAARRSNCRIMPHPWKGPEMMAPPVERITHPPLFWFASALLTLCAAAVAGGRGVPAAQAQPDRAKKIVFIAGNKSHGPGEHEYELGCRLLARSLETSPNLKG